MLPHHIFFYVFDQATNVRTAGLGPSGQSARKGSAMSESTDDHHNPGRYEIRLKGHLAPRWAAWFDGLSLVHRSDGTTIIHGFVADQAALHGLLQKVRDIGLPLVSVTQVEADKSDVSTIAPREGAHQSNTRRTR
jgi:hypothetical protein